MRWLLWMWLFPVSLLSLWYVLSLHDFGYVFFSRELHDQVFALYGGVLGIPPETIPGLVARAIALDTLVVLAICAVLRRKKIVAWLRGQRASVAG